MSVNNFIFFLERFTKIMMKQLNFVRIEANSIDLLRAVEKSTEFVPSFPFEKIMDLSNQDEENRPSLAEQLKGFVRILSNESV